MNHLGLIVMIRALSVDSCSLLLLAGDWRICQGFPFCSPASALLYFHPACSVQTAIAHHLQPTPKLLLHQRSQVPAAQGVGLIIFCSSHRPTVIHSHALIVFSFVRQVFYSAYHLILFWDEVIVTHTKERSLNTILYTLVIPQHSIERQEI